MASETSSLKTASSSSESTANLTSSIRGPKSTISNYGRATTAMWGAALPEGCSIRATERLTGIHRDQSCVKGHGDRGFESGPLQRGSGRANSGKIVDAPNHAGGAEIETGVAVADSVIERMRGPESLRIEVLKPSATMSSIAAVAVRAAPGSHGRQRCWTQAHDRSVVLPEPGRRARRS